LFCLAAQASARARPAAHMLGAHRINLVRRSAVGEHRVEIERRPDDDAS